MAERIELTTEDKEERGSIHSREYEAVLKFEDELARSLDDGHNQFLLQQFKLRGWVEFEDNFDADQLIDVVLQRIDHNTIEYYQTVMDLLLEIDDIREIINKITDICPLSPEKAALLGQGASSSSKELIKASENQEKSLKKIILQASAAGPGYESVMEDALNLLTRVQTKRPKKEKGINFSDGRGTKLLWTKQFYSPLMHASEGGHVEMVNILLEKGAKVEFISGLLESPKSSKKVKILGPKMNSVHVACIKGREEVLRLLLDKAGKHRRNVINAKTKDSWTPLMYAVKEGHQQVVRMLLEAADLDILTANKKGQTVLHIACMNGQLECLKLVHEKISSQLEYRKVLIKDNEENPYLHTDKKGYNVIHRVCKGPKGKDESTNVTVESLKWIFETLPHLDKRELLNLKTVEGFACLHLACDCNNEVMVEFLVKVKKVDIQSTTVDGKTGLHLAAIHNYSAIAILLIDNGISATIQDDGGNTALHIAMLKSSSNVSSLLKAKIPSLLLIRNKSDEVPDNVKPEDSMLL